MQEVSFQSQNAMLFVNQDRASIPFSIAKDHLEASSEALEFPLIQEEPAPKTPDQIQQNVNPQGES